jgi:hypothetical protein
MQLDFYYQFQVSIITQKIFLLKLYLFKVQISVVFFFFNIKIKHIYFENLLNI